MRGRWNREDKHRVSERECKVQPYCTSLLWCEGLLLFWLRFLFGCGFAFCGLDGHGGWWCRLFIRRGHVKLVAGL
jgi:hypothetical protein